MTTRSIPRRTRFLPVTLAAALAAACGGEERAALTGECNVPAAIGVVQSLGERMERVSLLAPDSVVVGVIRTTYAELVTPELLAAWTSAPRTAPGREVSSPWPDRIEVDSAEPGAPGECVIVGEVIYVASAEVAQDGVAAREPVTLRVREGDDGWRIAAYEAAERTAGDYPGSPAEAADAIRRYYAAIDEGDYPAAYAVWADSGAASGQTVEEFAAGFAETASVEVEVGEPGRMDPAAGSRYVEIPVVVRATTTDGAEQRFAGTYVMRRSVVDGAPEESRRWRIHSAEVASSP